MRWREGKLRNDQHMSSVSDKCYRAAAVRWTAEDDSKLLRAIEVYGEHGHWKEKAAFVGPDKLPCQAYQHWHRVLKRPRVPMSLQDVAAMILITVVHGHPRRWADTARAIEQVLETEHLGTQVRAKWMDMLDRACATETEAAAAAAAAAGASSSADCDVMTNIRIRRNEDRSSGNGLNVAEGATNSRTMVHKSKLSNFAQDPMYTRLCFLVRDVQDAVFGRSELLQDASLMSVQSDSCDILGHGQSADRSQPSVSASVMLPLNHRLLFEKVLEECSHLLNPQHIQKFIDAGLSIRSRTEPRRSDLSLHSEMTEDSSSSSFLPPHLPSSSSLSCTAADATLAALVPSSADHRTDRTMHVRGTPNIVTGKVHWTGREPPHGLQSHSAHRLSAAFSFAKSPIFMSEDLALAYDAVVGQQNWSASVTEHLDIGTSNLEPTTYSSASATGLDCDPLHKKLQQLAAAGFACVPSIADLPMTRSDPEQQCVPLHQSKPAVPDEDGDSVYGSGVLVLDWSSQSRASFVFQKTMLKNVVFELLIESTEAS
eukprot:ANDGO_03542.mRNA.1 hypothetical protein